MKKKQKTLSDYINELSQEEMADLLLAYVWLVPMRLERVYSPTGKNGIEVTIYSGEGTDTYIEGEGVGYKEAKTILEWLERD